MLRIMLRNNLNRRGVIQTRLLFLVELWLKADVWISFGVLFSDTC